ncbi:hypothetical protein BZG25_12630 [Salinivibrio sp. ML198]|nr:hypothetical protein BZG25_12630 [Salinivibrio sp. ML198]
MHNHGKSTSKEKTLRISVIAIARFGLFRSPDPAVFLSLIFNSILFCAPGTSEFIYKVFFFIFRSEVIKRYKD